MTLSSAPSRRRIRILGVSFCVVVIVLLSVFAWAWKRFQSSLPQLEGSVKLAGLAAPATIERDRAGVPTLRASSRVDLARATGFVHAQDRFFQMDLSRRRAAGELAELFGAAALPLDRGARLHELRPLARRVLAQMNATERALLEAYTAGVNAALSGGPRPWEYEVLRLKPATWSPEDSVLCIYAMVLDLQDENGRYEQTLITVRDILGPGALAFFAPLVGPADAALDGTTAPLPPPPSARAINLRVPTARLTPADSSSAASPITRDFVFGAEPDAFPDVRPGSNSFGLAGSPAGGAALLQNDMHLGLSVPTVWYRVRFIWPDSATPTTMHEVTGVTLPGAPSMAVGSNGQIAWGFTNSYADTGDLVLVQVDPVLPEGLYTLGSRPAEFERRTQTIKVKDAPDEVFVSRWTVWGPIVGESPGKHPLAHKWTFHDPEAVNLGLIHLETAKTAAEAIAIAHRSGVPPTNFLVADRAGDLAWTMAGKIPERFGHDGRLPISWAYGDRGWKGFLPPEKMPVHHAARGGAIWTANQRMMGGEMLDRLGDRGSDEPARAARIRDLVTTLAARPATEPSTPANLLAIALDDRGVFLDRWQKLLLDTLSAPALAGHPRRAELRRVAENWQGRATIDSASYHLVRTWRTRVATRALQPIFAPCIEAWPGFNFRALPQESPLWALLELKPQHLLAPEYATWTDLLLAAADDVTADFERQGIPLAEATWGRRNTLRMRHPFSRVLPAWLGTFLNMPEQPLPGDSNLPRVQSPTDGASQRMVVSPGREADGIFHQPGGQSGHPLSPYFRAGHDDWVQGKPSSFLPGEVQHTLKLTP